MPQAYVVLPMFAMVLLSFATLTMMFRARTSAVRAGEISAGYYKTYQGQSEPELNQKLSRHFINLFESPVLFYAACLSALATEHATTAFQLLAWAYVIVRALHAVVHLGRNKLRPRMAAYFVSWMLLLTLWCLLVYRILTT